MRQLLSESSLMFDCLLGSELKAEGRLRAVHYASDICFSLLEELWYVFRSWCCISAVQDGKDVQDVHDVY